MRKPEIERPGLNASRAISAPWKISSRLPNGSLTTIRSLTRRSSASARVAARDFDAGGFELCRDRIERRSVGHFPAEKGDTLPAGAVDDDALLAVVHAEGTRRSALVDPLKAEQPAGIFRPVFDAFGADADIAKGLNPGLSRHERSSRRKGKQACLILGLKQICQRNQRISTTAAPVLFI